MEESLEWKQRLELLCLCFLAMYVFHQTSRGRQGPSTLEGFFRVASALLVLLVLPKERNITIKKKKKDKEEVFDNERPSQSDQELTRKLLLALVGRFPSSGFP